MRQIYRPTANAVRRGIATPKDRVVFYQGGRAMLYREETLVNPLFNTAVAKTHFVKASKREYLPKAMNAFGKQAEIVGRNSLPLPCAIYKY